jgi:hypothetical protein
VPLRPGPPCQPFAQQDSAVALLREMLVGWFERHGAARLALRSGSTATPLLRRCVQTSRVPAASGRRYLLEGLFKHETDRAAIGLISAPTDRRTLPHGNRFAD